MFLNLKCTHAQKTGGKFILGYQQTGNENK